MELPCQLKYRNPPGNPSLLHSSSNLQACEWVVLEIQDKYRKKIKIQKKQADFRAKYRKYRIF